MRAKADINHSKDSPAALAVAQVYMPYMRPYVAMMTVVR
jgi:hypothetical protein